MCRGLFEGKGTGSSICPSLDLRSDTRAIDGVLSAGKLGLKVRSVYAIRNRSCECGAGNRSRYVYREHHLQIQDCAGSLHCVCRRPYDGRSGRCHCAKAKILKRRRGLFWNAFFGMAATRLQVRFASRFHSGTPRILPGTETMRVCRSSRTKVSFPASGRFLFFFLQALCRKYKRESCVAPFLGAGPTLFENLSVI
jgi:hypothetical protein